MIDHTSGKFASRFTVRTGSRIRVVLGEDVDWIGAAGDYTELHASGRAHWLREPFAAGLPGLTVQSRTRSRAVTFDVCEGKAIYRDGSPQDIENAPIAGWSSPTGAVSRSPVWCSEVANDPSRRREPPPAPQRTSSARPEDYLASARRPAA
jgi:hypothetical protein